MQNMHRYYLKEAFELSDDQVNLVLLAALTFIFQAVCFYIMNPGKFKMNWCVMCFIFAFVYNIAYFKFFLTSNNNTKQE